MSEAFIELQGVEKRFSSLAEDLAVLVDLDLSVQAGESVSITGASGSGKSTLLSIIGGLDLATKGSVRVGDWDLAGMGERKRTDYRAECVGFVFQFHYLLKDFDAQENVALPALMGGLPREAAMERAAALLESVGLSDRLHHYPSQLSGGERQRAAIARALVNSPPLLLADEPTGNLDAHNALSVRELIFDLVDRLGTTLILVTHDHGLAQAASARYELVNGRLSLL